MLGTTDKLWAPNRDYISQKATQRSRELRLRELKLPMPQPLNLKLGHDSPDLGKDDWTGQSDHGAFHNKGIPFLYFGVEDHEHYHKPTDTFENVNQEFFVMAAHAILGCILALDTCLN